MKAPLIRIAYGIALVSVLSYAYVTLQGPRGVHALSEKQTQIKQLEKRNEVLNQEIERRREHIKRLEVSPSTQELEIRERLKLVRPNEKIFITGEQPK